mmetsp:Transcript_29113/g.55006  ORF Transcript_29113/g.55006 Transcript_29113/m.55006 type:complete len:118 (-) Transcript_29113:130-483(-)
MATLEAGELLHHGNDACEVGGFESLQRPHHPRLEYDLQLEPLGSSQVYNSGSRCTTAGTVPESDKASLKDRYLSAVSCPRYVGMVPVRDAAEVKERDVSAVNCPRCVGIVPVRDEDL